MTWPEIASYAAVFLSGALTGAAGKYLGDKYTDQRHRQEARRASRRPFKETAAQMPELIAEMRNDLREPTHEATREFVVLPSSHVVFNSGGRPFLAYNEESHQNLAGKIAVLENNGFVNETTETNVHKYRMTGEFVRLLRE